MNNEKIIKIQGKMLDKISATSHFNWKKHKKYQYLYLMQKIESKDIEADAWDIIDKRIIFYRSWLNRIYKKYNLEKIQLKTAPTSNDVFWGTVISNTIESFDISDHTVDNFTGDGSTTQFSLSKDVPNILDILKVVKGR